LLSRRLGKVKGKTKDIDIWLAHTNKAGRKEGIRQLVQLERANAVRIDRARFIADHDDLQAMPLFELSDEFDHPGVRLRLSEHEVPKLIPREGSLFIKDHPAKVFLKRELSFFVGLEDEAMSFIHLCPIKIEVRGRSFAGQMVPPIGEQDPADIHKQSSNRQRSFH
jgi:hypothetical protein